MKGEIVERLTGSLMGEFSVIHFFLLFTSLSMTHFSVFQASTNYLF